MENIKNLPNINIVADGFVPCLVAAAYVESSPLVSYQLSVWLHYNCVEVFNTAFKLIEYNRLLKEVLFIQDGKLNKPHLVNCTLKKSYNFIEINCLVNTFISFELNYG